MYTVKTEKFENKTDAVEFAKTSSKMFNNVFQVKENNIVISSYYQGKKSQMLGIEVI